MTPLLQLRLWFRRAPVAERVATAVAGLVVVGLVAWALVPFRDTSGTTAPVAAGATAPGSATATTTTVLTASGQPGTSAGPSGSSGTLATGTAGGSVGGSTGAAPGGAGAQAASGPCAGLTASDQGVTPDAVHIAVSNISLAGSTGNSTFGIRGDLHQIVDAMTDGINKAGGVGCRKLVVTQYDVNPVDQGDERSKCLAMVADKVFAVLDFAGFVTPVSRTCFPQYKIPVQTSTSLSEGESQQAYPYMYSAFASSQRQVRDWVLGAKQLGVFDASKGFRKLGLLEDSCDPSVNDEIDHDLARIGMGSSQLSKFVLDCASLFAPPNQIQQAMLQHKLDGATNVFLATGVGNAQNYVQLAKQQGYSPVYGGSDYGSVNIPAGSWSDGWNNAVGITSTLSGEMNSGLPNATLAKCNQTMVSHGVPPATSEQKDGAVRSYCDLFNLFVAALAHAGPNPRRSDLLVGLGKIGKFSSAIDGDGLFDHPRKVTGGDFIRTIQWHSDCGCWKVLDPVWKPGF